MHFDSIEFGTRVRNLRENAKYTKNSLLICYILAQSILNLSNLVVESVHSIS